MTDLRPPSTPRPPASEAGRRPVPWRAVGWSAAALVLLVPLVAMALGDAVRWTASDFAFAAGLLLCIGLPLEAAARATADGAYRWAAALALGTAGLLVWVNGAVGVLGAEDNAANLLYGLVLAVGVVGALLARCRARGMASAMAATGLAQAAVAVGALIGGWAGPEAGPVEVVVANGVFVALWAAAAALFRRAARRDAPDPEAAL